MKVYEIYYLCDPDDLNDIKYVGCTNRNLVKRLEQHIEDAFKRNENDKNLWIKNLVNNKSH